MKLTLLSISIRICFSLTCVIQWTYKRYLLRKVCQHLKPKLSTDINPCIGISSNLPWRDFTWFFKYRFWLKFRLQIRHEKGFSSEWTTICLCSSLLVLKPLPHFSQMCFFSLVCVEVCAMSSCLRRKPLRQ